MGACGVNIGKTLTSSWIKISRLSDFKLNYFANTTYFKLSECDDVGGKLSRPVYLAPRQHK